MKEVVADISKFIIAVVVVWFFTITFMAVLIAPDLFTETKVDCEKFYVYEVIIPVAPIICLLRKRIN